MTAPRSFDHIVVVVRDLDAAAARYEALGFTLTPRAQHPDHMGTSNRLAQFANQTFIELLEIDRPETCAPHGDTFFSFGQHAQSFLSEGEEGMAMMVFAGQNAPTDAADFAEAGFGAFAPFDFGRKATLPDGEIVEVGFSLAYALPPGLGRVGFFTCHNHFPQNFWKPAFWEHANGATGMTEIYLCVSDPEAHRADLELLTGAPARPVTGGLAYQGGPEQQMHLISPERVTQLTGLSDIQVPGFAGVGLTGMRGPLIAPADASGLFLRPL
ncbi:MAG: VOC family protein [Pseudomonadota bacterium]